MRLGWQRLIINSYFYIACKQTLRERTSAVKHQNWDSAPLHKLIKNFPPFSSYQVSNYKIMQNIKPEGGR
jgi:hypothetical protein